MEKRNTYITLNEAAELAGVAYRTIKRWLQHGHLTKFKSGSRVYIDRAELLAYINPKPAV